MFENIIPFQLTSHNQRDLRDPKPTTLNLPNNHAIIDIRPHPKKTDGTLRESIQQCLEDVTTAEDGGAAMPDLFLWDEKGLRYFEDVTYLPSYYLTNEEIGLLERNKYSIAKRIQPGTMLVELGSGNLRKVKILLEALDELGRDVDYFALDVSYSELQRTLALVPPGHFNHVRCFGLLGTYDDGREWLRKPEFNSQPKTLISLGSTLGSFQRPDAADFLASFRPLSESTDEKNSPSFLIGLDGCKKGDRVWKAYNDPEGTNQKFVKNGLSRANQILGYDAFDLNHWHVQGIWDDENGRHIQYYYPEVDVNLGDGSKQVPAGKKLLAVWSHKYDIDDQNELAGRAGLEIAGSWSSDEGYSLLFLD